MRRTIKYSYEQWKQHGWGVGDATSQENAPYELAEQAPILRDYAPDLLDEVTKAMVKNWLSPTGDLTDAYLASCKGVAPRDLRARLAYGLYRANNPSWRLLFESALPDTSLLNSAEMAYLIDMSCERKT